MENDSKVVLITGASSGIGAATAERVAAAGLGGAADHDSLDVTDPGSVNAFVQSARARHGRIDVLVNNAGKMPLSHLDALRVDEWDQMVDVNLRGVLNGIAR